jgi:hypothetical protein
MRFFRLVSLKLKHCPIIKSAPARSVSDHARIQTKIRIVNARAGACSKKTGLKRIAHKDAEGNGAPVLEAE